MEPLSAFDDIWIADQAVLRQFYRGHCAYRPFAITNRAFEYSADTYSTAVAPIYNNKTMAYGELEAAGSFLSHKIQVSGFQPNERVCLVVFRSIEMIVAILAILKCRCQYILLDGKVVTDKILLHIFHDTAALFIRCLDQFQTKLSSCSDPGIQTQVMNKCISHRAFPPIRLECNMKSIDGAYIIYTSGTNEQPKASDVLHGDIAYLLAAAPGKMGIRLGTRMAQLLSVSFDMTAWEILGTLMNEGTLYEMQEDANEAHVEMHVEKQPPCYAVPHFYSCQPRPRTFNGKIYKKELAVWAEDLRGNMIAAQSAARSTKSSLPLRAPLAATSQPSCGSSDVEEEGKSELSIHELVAMPEPPAYELPQKKGKHRLRAVRLNFFSFYRRYFCVAFLSNFILLITLSVRARETQKIRLADLATASSVNITVAILMRQDYVINAIWTTFCSVPRSAPLIIRRYCAKVGIHLGGIHSGCAVAGSMWFTTFTVVATHDVVNRGVRSVFDVVVLVFSYLSMTLLISIIAVAHPKIRTHYHNHFEVSHRLLGWTALAFLWVQAFSFIGSSLCDPHLSYSDAVARSLDFWFLLAATVSVILPWLRLRLVKVRPEVLSSHAIRLHFDYCTPVPGTAVRISERPLLEWHAFGTIAKPEEKGFSLIISNAGDWTNRQIKRAPTSLYVRGIPACGVLRIMPLFRRVVLVATGSGIGPCLAIILARKLPLRILWSTPNPEDTFGREIIDNVLAADRDAVIHNTRTRGKPDMVAISWRLLQESRAEAVCIISNQTLTRKVVYAMEARGVPAYGAIWDS